MEAYHRQIRVTEYLVLTEMRDTDAETLVLYLNDPVIYNFTLTIPSPYKLSDAQAHLKRVFDFESQHNIQKDWAIRHGDDLIGSIGLLWNYGPTSHKSEIGYWLAAPYRGQGLMSSVIQTWSDYILTDTDLIRLEANVYPENMASTRALERAGFEKEGYLKKAFKKEERYRDAVHFGKTTE